MDLMASAWFWWGLALALLAVEAMMPGVFFLWLGVAAAGTGLVHLLIPGIAPQGQWVVFALLSLVAVGVAWRVRGTRVAKPTDQPLLNQRAQQLVGRVYVLDTAIDNGRGRLKIGDAYWSAEGPDLPAGTRVRVLGVQDMTLRVIAAE
jgi:membrane protein implicated in regulation of membrane protease activity